MANQMAANPALWDLIAAQINGPRLNYPVVPQEPTIGPDIYGTPNPSDPRYMQKIQRSLTRPQPIVASSPTLENQGAVGAEMGPTAGALGSQEVAPMLEDESAVSTEMESSFRGQGVDPDILRRQAAGLNAADELSALMDSPKLIQALRNANQAAPGVVGEGYAAAGPTLMQGLAHMVTTRQGQNDLREIEKQAAALRGVTAEGRLAQLQAQDARNRIAQEFKMQQVAEQRKFTRAQMDDQFKKEKQLQDERLAAQERKTNPQFGDLPVFAQQEVIAAREGIDQINAINQLANSLTPEMQKQLNRPGIDLVVKAMTPKQAEEYQLALRGVSPEVREYLARVQDFAADIRHQRFGSALTMNEQAISGTFLPSADGLFLNDRQKRLAMFQEKMRNNVKGIQDSYKVDLGYILPPSIEYESSGAVTPKDEFDSLSDADLEKTWLEMKAKLKTEAAQ